MPDTRRCSQCGAELLGQDAGTSCSVCDYPVRHRGFQSAWRKGYNAAPGARCPYLDYRTDYHNGVTFSATWRRFWDAGQVWAARQQAASVAAPPTLSGEGQQP